jgi:hypothetical protein
MSRKKMRINSEAESRHFPVFVEWRPGTLLPLPDGRGSVLATGAN